MDYRKAMNTKKKINESVINFKNFAKENATKAKDFTTTKTENLREDIKKTTSEFKNTISTTIKNKLEQEFRKNYPSYAISYMNELLVTSFSEGNNSIVLVNSVDEITDTLTTIKLMNEISEDMLSEEVAMNYKTKRILNNLFEFLYLYFSNEPQLKVKKDKTSITISLAEKEVNSIVVDTEKSE